MMMLSCRHKNEAGFTLLECILAVGILSLVIALIVGLQSSIVSVTQISGERMKASWALQSTISQLQYLIETRGQDALPESVIFPWEGDSAFSVEVMRTPLKDIKVSTFLGDALSLYNSLSPEGNANLDMAQMISQFATGIDAGSALLPTSGFSHVTIRVSWTEGMEKTNSLEEVIFLVDDTLLTNFSLPPLATEKNSSDNQSSQNQTGNRS